MTKPHNGIKRSAVIGEQYVDMISGWYTVKDDNPVGAYLSMNLETDKGTFKVDNRGGCCDNDVHEHFKCLEEVALTSAYVILKMIKLRYLTVPAPKKTECGRYCRAKTLYRKCM